ncbi:MAG: 4,5-dihydroxyphthalate decarboxylase [Rhodospirillales bacterium]|nr:4,5-dihydroxyphthalate decarboxylase [Rhodospirillales bacterium]
MTTTLSLGCWDYDRVKAVLDGRVTVNGFALKPTVMAPTDIFARAFTEAPFDVSELSLSSYMLQVANGNCAYVAIPAFLSRAFRHGGIFVRADRGIKKPKDLQGRLVGVPEYQMTMAMWVRGILQDEHGVDFRNIRWRTGGLHHAGRKERLALDLPAAMDVKPIGATDTLNGLLAAGELDAVVAPTMPAAFLAGDANVRRLFADPVAAERAYYKKTGMFPIMHVLGLRRTIADKHPNLAAELFRAFVKARDMALTELKVTAEASANRVMLPWFAAEWEATRALMGEGVWTYGVEKNIKELEAACRYSEEQNLAPRRLAVDELFHPATRDLADA